MCPPGTLFSTRPRLFRHVQFVGICTFCDKALGFLVQLVLPLWLRFVSRRGLLSRRGGLLALRDVLSRASLYSAPSLPPAIYSRRNLYVPSRSVRFVLCVLFMSWHAKGTAALASTGNILTLFPVSKMLTSIVYHALFAGSLAAFPLFRSTYLCRVGFSLIYRSNAVNNSFDISNHNTFSP